MFADDRDLLVLEPNVFADVAWVGQRLVSATGTLAGRTLTVPGVDLAASGVSPGCVVVFDQVPLEVLDVTGATTMEVSLIRGEPTDAPITPRAGTNRVVSVVSFRPQVRVVHGQVLRMIGVEPGAAGGAGTLGESAVTNPRELWLVEALGALYLVYAAAAALIGPDSPAWARAEMYRERFARERWRAVAKVDLDGDGAADASRRLNVLQFVRG